MSDRIFKWVIIATIIVLLPVAAWERIAETFNLEFEAFVRNNGGMLVSLGTLGLVSLLAIGTTLLANEFADKREAANRKIQSELKLSEFRQKWIDELRSDLALLISISTKLFEIEFGERRTEAFQMKELEAKIRLRLNPSEPPAMKLLDSVKELIFSVETKGSLEMYTSREKMAGLATDYLKNEWDELKAKLGKAEGKDTHK